MTSDQEAAVTALVSKVGIFIANMEDKPVAEEMGWEARGKLGDTGHFQELKQRYNELKAIYKPK